MTAGANVGWAIMSALSAAVKAHPRIRVRARLRVCVCARMIQCLEATIMHNSYNDISHQTLHATAALL